MIPESKPIKGVAIPGPHVDVEGVIVRSVCSGPNGLDILLEDSKANSNIKLNVHFGVVYGFRVLDEGDLNDFWSADWDDREDGLIYQILCGGWFDQEKARPGFIGAYEDWAKEYFIIGCDDCVNVIAGNPPVIEVLDFPQ